MEQEKEGSLWKEFFADIAAGMLIAAGLRNFALHADFPVAGFTGIAVILYHVAGIPVGAGTVLLNIPVAILCYRSLGKAFFFRSVRSTLIVSFLTDYIAPLFPVYTGDRLLAALCTGGLCGMGYALIFLQGSSTGGQDFISLWIRKKRPYLSLGAITFALDGVIILLGTALVFRDMDRADLRSACDRRSGGGDQQGLIWKRPGTARHDRDGKGGGDRRRDQPGIRPGRHHPQRGGGRFR